MKKEKVLYGQGALDGIFKGAEQVVMAVGSTIGSRGRNVIIGDFGGSSKVTNDGVTVARSIYLPDPIENIGAHFVKTAASSTEEESGDGTTTTTLILGALLQGGKMALEYGVHPVEIKEALEAVSKDIVGEIDELSTEIGDDIESLVSIATISANNDPELGRVIGESFYRVGRGAKITVKKSSRIKGIEFQEVSGMTIDRGVESRAFMPMENSHRRVMERVHVLITDISFRYNTHTKYIEDVITKLQAHKEGDYRLIILGDSMDQQLEIALSQLRFNQGQDITFMKAPEFADTRADACYDMAAYLGGTFFTPAQKDLGSFDLDDLGYCESVVLEFGKGSKTTFAGGVGDKEVVEKRVASIQEMMDKEDDEFYIQNMKTRISNLTGTTGVIHVGGTSEVEVDEKIFRIDDTLRAVECAMEEGYVVGGGMTLYNIKNKLQTRDYDLNKTVLKFALSSLESPLRTIIENSGGEFSEYFPDTGSLMGRLNTWLFGKYPHLNVKGMGYDSNTGQIEDLLKMGVIDPSKVTKSSVVNAFATAVLVLTSQTVVKPTEIIS